MRVGWLCCWLCVYLMGLGCERQATCSDFAARQLSCARKVKDKESLRLVIWNFCNTQLTDEKTRDVMKRKLLCLQEKTCAAFSQCEKRAESTHKKVQQQKKVVAAFQQVRRYAREKRWYQAQKACTQDQAAVKLKQMTASPHPQVLAYYRYCLTHIPDWLRALRQQGATHTDFHACYDQAYLHRAQATPKQLRKIRHACIKLEFSQKLQTVKKNRKKYLSLQQFPWQCRVKEAQSLTKLDQKAAHIWLSRYQQLCYHEIGYQLLQRYRKKLARSKQPFCGYYPKKIMQGFHQWKIGKPEQQAILQYFAKLCKMER